MIYNLGVVSPRKGNVVLDEVGFEGGEAQLRVAVVLVDISDVTSQCSVAVNVLERRMMMMMMVDHW